MMNAVDEVKKALGGEREALLGSLRISDDWGTTGLRLFLESHVWAVWDFMSLVKKLQRELTCVEVPWRPVGDPELRRFVNEIVWGEESDLDRHGRVKSHFEMYLEAMEGVGADTHPIRSFLVALQSGTPLRKALADYAPSAAVRNFVSFTFDVIDHGLLHELAAVFTFGREDLIPDMFHVLVNDLSQTTAIEVADLLYYLDRHIEVDGDDHGPIALKLVEQTLGSDPERLKQASQVARRALELRRLLWEDITQRIDSYVPTALS